MDKILAALPRKMRTRTKAIVAAIGAVLLALVQGMPNIHPAIVTIVAVLTALGVYAVPAPGYEYSIKE